MLVELFEARVLMAGNVSITIADGVFRLRGDAADNNVGLIADSDTAEVFRVAAMEGTTITLNGRPYRNQEFSPGLLKQVVVEMGEGDDKFGATGCAFFGLFAYSGENGSDSISLTSVRIDGSAALRGAAGNDRFVFSQTTLSGDVTFDGGAGRDRLSIGGLSVAGSFAWTDRSQGSSFFASKLTVRGDMTLITGAGTDSIEMIRTAVFGDARVATSDGDDVVVFRGCTFVTGKLVDVGFGRNIVEEV